MANYFYADANGQKQDPVTEQELQELADQGIINPNTRLVTDTGHKGLAGQIPGLSFHSAVSAPFGQTAQTLPVPPPPKQMFCTNCGSSVSEQAVACMSCGARPVGHRKFCRHCAATLSPEQVICTKCGAGISSGGMFQNVTSKVRSIGGGTPGAKSKVAAGLLAILLGGLGVHKFYMGSWGWGSLYLANLFLFLPIASVLAVITVGLLSPLVMLSGIIASVQGIVSLIEGIIYLTMSDENFAAKYPPETQSAFRW